MIIKLDTKKEFEPYTLTITVESQGEHYDFVQGLAEGVRHEEIIAHIQNKPYNYCDIKKPLNSGAILLSNILMRITGKS